MAETSSITVASLTTGRLLAKNALFNLLGQAVPLIVAFFCIPPLMHRLGVERFGILTLTWMVIGYFTLFDLGLSRATTKFLAEALGKGIVDKLPDIVWTSFLLHLLLGTGAGLLLAALTPLLVGTLFKIPPTMISEATGIFLILALSLPIILMSTVLRGVIEAAQRFDLINIVQTPAGALMFLLPLVGLYLGLGLTGIAILLVAARLATLIIYFTLCRSVFPQLRNRFLFDPLLVRPLFSFGGWMTLSNIVGPLLLYLDRFVIGTVVSLAAITYYAAPFEVVIRLMVFPASMIMVLFPAFSAFGTTSRETVVRLYIRSMKYLFLLMGPVVLFMILFAHEILLLWLGPDFAQKSTLVFQVLAAGMLLTPVQVSVSLIHGLGRPDITAKFYLLELFLYIPLIWLLVSRMGIVGAALAWTLRALLDTVLLLVASGSLYNISYNTFKENRLLRSILFLLVLSVIFYMTSILGVPFITEVIFSITGTLLFTLTTWRYCLDENDREILSLNRLR
jgi:O-antigen/teichoic acid export membrane protein